MTARLTPERRAELREHYEHEHPVCEVIEAYDDAEAQIAGLNEEINIWLGRLRTAHEQLGRLQTAHEQRDALAARVRGLEAGANRDQDEMRRITTRKVEAETWYRDAAAREKNALARIAKLEAALADCAVSKAYEIGVAFEGAEIEIDQFVFVLTWKTGELTAVLDPSLKTLAREALERP